MLRRPTEPIVRLLYERGSPRLIRALPWPLHRLAPRRFEQELERLIRVIRSEGNCLVLVLNVNPTSERVERALPGVKEHAVACSRIIERVVSTAGDGVRLID